MNESIDPLEDELSAMRPRKLTPELRRRIAARLTETAPDKASDVDSAPSPPGTPGGEGWGEGGQNPSRNHSFPAGVSPLTPNPTPPEYRGSGEIGSGCSPKQSREWRIAMVVVLAAACVATFLVFRWPPPSIDRERIAGPKPTELVAVPEWTPTLQSYQLALARSPEDLDTLLDKQPETTLAANVEPVQVCTFLWSEEALHLFLGDD